MSYKARFSRALGADPDRVHLAAHSHHLWPDVAREAHMEAWDDAARLADRKWDKVFGEVIPGAQRRIAELLNLYDPGSIAFAPNTHDFVRRILSCLRARPRVLTTSSEFHSFERQTRRLEEDDLIEIVRVPSEPYATLSARMCERAAEGGWDLVFFSHVLFDSGHALDFEAIARAAPDDAMVVIDGYHGFLAVPTDLRAIERRVFYMSGGYKYAMSGEGCCFLHAPPGWAPRPRDTGWFASFGTLTDKSRGVPYAAGGARFYGATFDPTAVYRLRAVLDWLAREGLGAAEIRAHVRPLKELFALARPIDAELVIPASEGGQFLTYRTERAQEIQRRLERANVICDARGDRLRFGFGLYHDMDDVKSAALRVKQAG